MPRLTNRRMSFDVIRLIAVASVVMVHCSGVYGPSSDGFFAGNILNGISRGGVPLFFMVSGALMLDENREVDAFGQIRKIGPLLIGWSLIYALLYHVVFPAMTRSPISVSRFLHAFVFGNYHLWYLYAQIGLYLVTPALRCLTRKNQCKIVASIIILNLILNFTVPLLDFAADSLLESHHCIKKFTNAFHVALLGNHLTYYLSGWLLSQACLDRKARAGIYTLGLLGLSASIFGAYFGARYVDVSARGVIYDGIGIYFYSVSIFVLMLHVCRPEKTGQSPLTERITRLSVFSFGVYAVHELVLSALRHYVLAESGVILAPGIWLCTMVISFFATYLLSKIPVLKRLVRC